MKTLKNIILAEPTNKKRGFGFRKVTALAGLMLLTGGTCAEASGTYFRSEAFSTPLFTASFAITDADITKAIKTEFEIRPNIPSKSINVSTTNGIVSLTGTTNNLLAKDRAEEVALALKGVRGVINQIVVVAPDRTDEEIRKDVEKALLLNPATDSYEVQANVKGGKVTLTGDVQSWGESQLALLVAKKVKGVKQVENNIVIKLKENRLDNEIAADIQQQYRYDTRLGDALIAVSVNK